jgi:glycerol-3-phosphate acyltransferase PlsY
VLIALQWGEAVAIPAGLGAFIGHLYPVWLKFKGGKGVATYLGCLVAFWWPAALAFAVIWLAIAGVTKYSSAAALVASALTPLILWQAGHGAQAELFVALALLLWLKHRPNIERLIAGTEGRIGAKT